MFASPTGMKVSWGGACTMFNAACPDYDMPGPTFDKYLVSCCLKIHGNTEKRQSQGDSFELCPWRKEIYPRELKF